MTRKNNIVVLTVLLVLFSVQSARADIMDEEDEPVVTPKPAEAPVVAPSIKPVPVPPEQGAISDKKPVVKPVNKKPSTPPAKGATGNKNAKPGSDKNEPVHFESKGLRGLREKGTVELIEDVVVTQGDLRVEADRAQLFYDGNQREVVKVVANGNVKMFNIDQSTGEKMRAFCDQVVFLNSERTVVMEGNARLWRGTQSVIRGKKITYEMDSGWIKADRVEGELQPEEAKK